MPTENPELKMSQAQLLELIKELRKPPEPTDDEKARKATEIQNRKDQAELVKANAERKRIEQEYCTHLRKNQTTLGVYVQNGNFIVCQGCQKIIRPEEDVNLFNKLFVLCFSNADIV